MGVKDRYQNKKKDDTVKSQFSVKERYDIKSKTDTSKIDQSYIDSFIDEANLFYKSSQDSYSKIGYDNKDSIYNSKRGEYDSIKDKGIAIKLWLEENQGTLDESYVKDMTDAINSILGGGQNTLSSIDDLRTSISKFDSKKEYEHWLEDIYNAENIDKADEEKIKQEINELKAQLSGIRADTPEFLGLDLYNPKWHKKKEQGAIQEEIARKNVYLKQVQDYKTRTELEGKVGQDANGQYDEDFLLRLENEIERRKNGISVPFSEFSNHTTKELKQLRDAYKTVNTRDIEATDVEVFFAPLLNSLYEFDIIQEYEFNMTEEERNVFNSLISSGYKKDAMAYLDAIKDELIIRKGEDIAHVMEVTGQEGIFAIAAGLDQFTRGLVSLVDNSGKAIDMSSTQVASSIISQHLDENGLLKDLPQWAGGGSALYDAVTTTSNMIPSILASYGANYIMAGSGAYVGATLMGASAAGNAKAEMLRMGYNKQQAEMYGLMVGASEGALQYLLGGISSLGGTATSSLTTKILSKVDNALARVSIVLGANAVSEGFEESLQTVLETWFKEIATGVDFDSPDIDEILFSGLLGALMGAFFGTSGAISEATAISERGSMYKDSQSELVNEAIETGAISEKKGQKYLSKIADGKSLSGTKLATMSDRVETTKHKADRNKISSVVAERLAELGETNKQVINAVTKSVAGEDLSVIDKVILSKNKNASKVVSEFSTDSVMPSYTKQIGTDIIKPELYSSEYVDPNTYDKNNDVVSIKSLSVSKGGATVETSTGEKVDIKDLDLSSNDEVLIKTAISLGLNSESATQFYNEFKNTEGMSAEAYARGFKEAYLHGEYNLDESEYDSKGLALSLSESSRRLAYRLGQIDAKYRAESKQTEIDKAKTDARKTLREGTTFVKKGKVHYDESIDIKSLTEFQRGQLSLIENLSKAFGIETYVYESMEIENGFYDPDDSSIHLALNAGADSNSLLTYTMSHELTHFIKDWSPTKYKAFCDILMEHYAKEGQSVQDLVAEQITKAKAVNIELTYDEAFDEVIADSCEKILSNEETLAEISKQIKAKDIGLWNKIKSFFARIISKLNELLKGIEPDSNEGKIVSKWLDKANTLQKAWAEMFVDAAESHSLVKSNAKPISANEIITDGATVTEADGKVYSIKSMKHDIQEGKMFDDLKQYCGWTDEQVKTLKSELKSLVDYMNPYRDILDFNETYGKEGRRYFPYKPNNDPLYAISMDFSTQCSKRLLMQYVIEELQAREERPLTAEEQMTIRDMLKEYRKVEKALQVTCVMCYVESARLKSPKQIQRWLDDTAGKMRDYFASKNPEFSAYMLKAQEDFKESRGYDRKATSKELSNKDRTELRKIRPRLYLEYKPSAEEQIIIDRAVSLPKETFLKASNLATLSESEETYDIFKAFTDFVRTATRSKAVETDEPYYYGDSNLKNKSGMVVSDSFIESVNRENGMRFSSWSDWQIQHLLDFITAVIDLSVRGSAMHGYTKFADEVRILGKTNMMFNLSGVAGTQTGLNEDGSLNFSDVESINIDDAIELREEFPETAGLQCIGVSNEHIYALLRSDIIDYVIPYHTSGLNASLRRMGNIYGWQDFTNTQHATEDKSIKKESAKDKANWHKEPIFSEFFVGYDTGLSGTEAMKKSADNYIRMCKERGLTPKFNEFVNEPNYWKLLIDRKMVNQQTNTLIKQKPVQPNFDFDVIKGIIDKYVSNYDGGLESRAFKYIADNWDSIPSRIKELKKQGTNAKATKKAVDTLKNETVASQPKGIKRSLKSNVDSLGRELTEAQQEFFKDSKVRDADGNLLEVYHGSQSKFTEFKYNKVGLHGNAHGRGFYFTDDVGLASSFYKKEGQLLNGYLNITNPMSETEKTIKKADLEKFIKLICEDEAKALVEDGGYDSLSDALKDTFISNYVYTYDKSMRDAYREMTSMVYEGNDNDVEIIAELTNAYGGSSLLERVYDIFGYDGVIYTNFDGTHEYVVFNSNQFKETSNKNPTKDKDIRYSLKDPRKATEEDVRGILDNVNKYNSDSYFPVRINTPKALIEAALKRGDVIEDLPIVMQVKKAQQAMSDEVIRSSIERAHGLSTDDMIAIIRAMDEPAFIVYQENERYVEIVRFETESKKRAIAVLEIGENKNAIHMNGYEGGIYQVLVTAFVPDNYQYIKDILDNKKNTILPIEKKKGSSQRSSGSQVPSLLNDSPFFNPIVSQSTDSVKKYSLKNYKEGLSETDQKVAEEIIERLKNQTMFAKYGTTRYASYTPKRINYEIASSSADFAPDYANSYIAWVRPDDFLYATTVSSRSIERIKEESTKLDVDRLREQRQPIYLAVDFETGKIVGHEGRHRMTALKEAGIEKVAVIIEARHVYYPDNEHTKPIEIKHLGGQTFGDYGSGQGFYLHDALPLSQRYAEVVKKLFAFENAKGVSYSLKGKSMRTQLAEALETVAVNEDEVSKLNEYKKIVGQIEKYETRLKEVKAELKELSFAKGTRDVERISALREESTKLEDKITKRDKRLLQLESTKAIKNILERQAKRLKAEARTIARESMMEVHESRDKKDAKAKLQKTVLNTIKWLTNPSKTDVKCPDILKEPYYKLLQVVDLSSKRALKGGEATQNDLKIVNAMNRLAITIEKISTSQNPAVVDENGKIIEGKSDSLLDASYLDLPSDFVQSLRDFATNIDLVAENYGTDAINRLNSAQIKDLNKFLVQLNSAIKNMANLSANLRYSNVVELANESIEYLKELGTPKYQHRGVDFVRWDNALPYYAFKKFGKAGESLFEELMDAQDRLAFLGKEMFDFQEKTWTEKEAKTWGEEKIEVELSNGETISMTIAQAMGIYCLSRRVDADGTMLGIQHMVGGGIYVVGKKKFGKTETGIQANLTRTDIDKITDSLTDRQKEVARSIQEYMSTTCADWGNEISIKRFMTKDFTEKLYYPMESNDQNLKTEDPKKTQSDLFRLLNISATKSLTKGANNQLVIRDIFEVFVGHASDMARLNAFGMAMLDMMKWLNYRNRIETGDTQFQDEAIKGAMDKAFGEAAEVYVLNLIKDINGRFSDSQDNPLLMKMMRLGKTASVGANLRVALLQFTSYPRASMVLSSKSLALGLTKVPKIEMAKKYCGIALWKSFGFYDTNISRSIEEQLRGTKNISQKLIELSMKGAEWADAITWGALWNACEFEVAKTTKNKVGSEEFYKEVGLKLRQVVYETQVVDSVLTRSQIMRSKSGLTQAATAFMSEPTLTANILLDAVWKFNEQRRITGSTKEAWRVSRKFIFKAVTNYCMLQLVVSLAEALADAWRDDDNEDFKDKFLEAFKNSAIDNFNPFNKIPIISNISDAIMYLLGYGYGASSSGLEWQWLTSIQNAYTSWKEIYLDSTGEKSTSKTVYKAIYDTIKAISSGTGLPINNAMRELVAVWNNTAGLFDATLKLHSYETSNEELGNLLYDAIVDGNRTEENSVRESFESKASMERALKKALYTKDARIVKAAQLKYEGDYQGYTEMFDDILEEGNFDEEIILGAIQIALNVLEKENSTETETDESDEDKAVSKYTNNDVNVAYENGDNEMAQSIIKELIETKMENGMDEKSAKASIKSSMTAYWKPIYQEAYKKKNNTEMVRIRKILYKSGLYGSTDEVVKTANRWTLEK